MQGDSPISTELASVMINAGAGSMLLIGGALVLGLGAKLAARALLGPAPRGARRLSRRQMLRAARSADYAPAPLLNRPERKLFAQVEAIVRRDRPGCRVMGQVALSEVVRPSGRSERARHALEAILGRSLDMAIVDRRGRVSCAIEYQGAGHYQNDAETRDAIKAEILATAGIPLIAVPERWDARWLHGEILRRTVREHETAQKPSGRRRRRAEPPPFGAATPAV